MKATFGLLLTLLLLTFPAPAQAAGWADDLLAWFAGFFEVSTPTFAVVPSRAQLDSLRLSPSGLLLNEVPDADTLAIDQNWPYEAFDVVADLDRYTRLLKQTVLLTRPAGKLPLRDVPAVRLVYRYDQRPAKMIAMASRFADVQEVAFDKGIGLALPVGLDLPTIVVTDDPVGQSTFNGDWYHALYELTTANITLLHFGDPSLIIGVPTAWSVINSPLRCKESEAFLAQALFGAELIDGRLAVTTPVFSAGTGYRLEPFRGGFRLPEQLGIDRKKLEYVDYQINRGIRYRAMPGAQLLVMKDGHVVYEKAYGHQTYRNQPVTPGDLYDLASVTKAAATTLAVMKLFDDKRIELDAEVRDYLPEFKRKVIGRFTIERLLAHHTGLQSEIPIYGLIGKQYVADSLSEAFSLPISQDRWLDKTVPAMVRKHLSGRISYTRRQVYKYSDLNYYLLQLVVEQISGESLADFMDREYYVPLHLGRMGFRPAGKFPPERLVPTVIDRWMRGGLLRGYVHDEGAALLGGVAGHAGLFSNAYDLGQLFQLLNNKGEYAGQQRLSPETVARFTASNRYNYRALGFDRLTAGWQNVLNAGASTATIGHLGFSGTSVWADPENDLVFVLLTNRVHPDPKNDRFQNMQIRGKVHQGLYQAMNTWELVN
jgi:CubicO group peptidase (beta-lactamase class C family)